MVENNKCTIPGEVLLNHALPLYVGLIGIQADPYLVVTTNIIELPLVQGMSRDHSQTPAITPTIYDQLLQAFTEMYNDTIAAVANKQDKTDNNLETEDKTVVGAINEIIFQKSGADLDGVVDLTEGKIYQCTSNQSKSDNVYIWHEASDYPLKNSFVKGYFYKYLGYSEGDEEYNFNLIDVQDLADYYVKGEVDNLLHLKQDIIQMSGDVLDDADQSTLNRIYQCNSNFTTHYSSITYKGVSQGSFINGYFYQYKGNSSYELIDVQDLNNYYNQPETDALLDAKQDKTDNSLQTTSKTVVGAINEVNQRSKEALSNKADKSTVDNHIANTNNPHNVTKAQVNLGNVDNTSDVDKPISTATQAALNIMNSAIDTKQQKFANTEETGGGDYILTPLQNASEVLLSGRFRFHPDPDANENSADIVNRAILENAILPLATYDDVNRALATKQDVFYKTSLDSVLVQNTMYDLGSLEQSSVTLTLPTSGNSSCREIYVAFKSGSTATALNIINSYVGDTSYVPSPDSICELSFKYICGTWVLVAKDTPLSNT